MSNTLGVRMNSFSESFSTETEQDATSILTELDKGKILFNLTNVIA